MATQLSGEVTPDKQRICTTLFTWQMCKSETTVLFWTRKWKMIAVIAAMNVARKASAAVAGQEVKNTPFLFCAGAISYRCFKGCQKYSGAL